MEIDLFSLVLGISCFAIFMAPVFVYEFSQKRKQKKLLSLLEGTAAANHLSLDEKELFHTGFGLGLDQKNNVLVWVHRHSDTEVRKQVVQLAGFDTCTVYKSQTRPAAGSGIIHNEIGLNLKSRGKPTSVNLPVCTAEQGRLAGDEEISAGRWRKKIQACLDV